MVADIAFMDIDTQFDFADPEGKLYANGAAGIRPNLKRLTDAAVAKGIPIVGSVDTHTEDDPEFEEFPPHCVKGTPGQNKITETSTENMRLIPMDAAPGEVDLSPPGPVIVEKADYAKSFFHNPLADKVLEATGAKKFAVYGIATEYCVGAAANGLLDRGYEVVVVTDAIRAIDPMVGDKTLNNLKKRGAGMITTQELLKEIE